MTRCAGLALAVALLEAVSCGDAREPVVGDTEQPAGVATGAVTNGEPQPDQDSRPRRPRVTWRAVNDVPGIDHPAFGSVPGGARSYKERPERIPDAKWTDPHCHQIYRLFLPAGEPPEHGWPVLVNLDLGGFASSSDYRELRSWATGTESRLAAWLEHGVAVINALATPSTDRFECTSLPEMEATVLGAGLFQPPGFVPGGMDIAPYDDWRFAFAEKDAVMLVQHVRHHAGEAGHLLEPLYRGPDGATRIAVAGTSAAAISMLWTTVGRERRDERPFVGAGGQYTASARPDAAILLSAAVWWPIFSGNQGRGFVHFGVDGDEGLQARKLGQANPDVLVAASALHYDARCDDPVPLYLMYVEPSMCTDYATPDRAPCGDTHALDLVDGGLDGPNGGHGFHPAWSGYTWKLRHPETRLVIRNQQAWEQRGASDVDGDGAPDVIEAVFLEPQRSPRLNRESHLDMVQWLRGVFPDESP